MIDDEIHLVDDPAEVVGLYVNGCDPVELGERLAVQRLDMDVEEAGHPEVLGSRDPLERPDDRGGLGPVQEVAQGETAGHRVRIRVVVQQDQHTVGVGQIALVLLDPRACHRALQLRAKHAAQEVRQRQMSNLGRASSQFLLPPGAQRVSYVEQIDEDAAGIADRLHGSSGTASSGVLDEHAGAGVDVSPQVALHRVRIADVYRDLGVVQPARQKPVFDQELDVQGRFERLGQDPDDELVLAHREALHGRDRRLSRSAARTVDYMLPPLPTDRS